MASNLFTKSYYSLLESTLSVNDIVRLTKENGMKSVALCDHNVMYGSIAFYRACMKNDLKPILGLEADIVYDEYACTVILLARNNRGYKKLVQLSTWLNTTKERLTLEEVFDTNLIMIMPSDHGIFDRDLINYHEKDIYDKITYIKENVSYFYIGLVKQEFVYNAQRNEFIRDIARRCGIKTVALEKALYDSQEKEELLRALLALGKKTTIKDPNVSDYSNYAFHSTEELLQLFPYEDILTTDEISNLCTIDIDAEHCELLSYPKTQKVSSKEYLRQLCILGLKKRFQNQEVPLEYQKRLNYELSVISKMKYDDYFLIVYDFIRYAKSQGIYVGPGRGSAAGSIVAYCLGITHIDPIKYGLLFERFLNPERVSMPDIDVDFPDNRRQEVIDYVVDKYGVDRVAHIIAFSTMQAKAAVDAACEALGVEKRRMDYAKRYLPRNANDKTNKTLVRTYETNIKFRQLIDSEEDFQQVFHLAVQLEGMPKNITTHACGIVMSDKPLTDVIPLCNVDSTMLSTQISAEYLEDLGLLKMDFLGIRNLSIIDKVCSEIEPKIDILKIPQNDSKAYELISRGDTIGIFQLESEGMKNVLRKVKPKNMNELSDCLALFRPSAMANIDAYVKNRADPMHISYIHPDLEDILKPTYGIIIYQEQAMQIAQKAARFTLGKADLLRQAMSKKKEKELLALKDDFLNGCRKNGYSEETSNQLYDLILRFAGYGFNKSHSVAYSLVAYQMAYLKINYPKTFMCKLMDNVIGDESKTAQYIDEARKLGIKVYPLSVNDSLNYCKEEEEGIRLPLRCIKGLGNATVEALVYERNSGGEFTDFFDFVARANQRKVNRSNIENLIDAGAMDEFGFNRASLRASLDDALRYAELIKVDNPEQSYLDFNLVYKPLMTSCREYNDDKLNREQNALGFYLSSHPIQLLKEKMNYQGISISSLRPTNSKISILCRIVRVKNHMAKTGSMAFVSADDESGSVDVVVLPNVYSRYQDLILKGNYVIITGRVDNRGEKISLVADSVKEVNP